MTSGVDVLAGTGLADRFAIVAVVLTSLSVFAGILVRVERGRGLIDPPPADPVDD